MKERIISIIVVMALLISFPLLGISAEDSDSKILNGVALGDSVAAFYGVEEEESYVSQLSAILTASGIENNFTNLAVSGYDTTALLAQLEEEDVLAQLTNADIITLNIGGNNILIPLIEIVKQELKALNISDMSKVSPAVMMAFATKKLSDDEQKAILKGVDKFKTDFPAIIEILHKAAPNATLLVNNVYNPIPSLLGLYESAESMISVINDAIAENAETGGYIAVDVYSAYKASNGIITNFDINSGSLDIHPNAAGHALIAKTVIDILAGGSDEKSEDKNDESDTTPVYLTRGEVIAEIMNIFAPLMPKVGKASNIETEMFKDVTSEHKNFEAIMAAKKIGIILGSGNSRFNVDKIMTRQDFAVIMLRVISIASNMNVADIISNADLMKTVASASDFGEISSYAQESVAAAVALGIFEIEDGKINPKNGITSDFINSVIANIIK